MDYRNWLRGRRVHIGSAAVAVAVVATLGGVALAVANHRGNPDTAAIAPGSDRVSSIKLAPKGTRYESSLGLQIRVPDMWKVNDSGCGQTDAPSVNRGVGVAAMCYTPTPPRKEWANIQNATDRPAAGFDTDVGKVKERAGVLDGVPIRRAAGPIANGMFAGWITVPQRDVALVARTRTMATLNAILDSAELVNVDHLGCATTEPTGRPPRAGTRKTFVDPQPTDIAICFYGDVATPNSRLESSASQTGEAAIALASALNGATHGENRDLPADRCLRSALRPRIDVVLLVFSRDRSVQMIYVTVSSCTDRHLDNGTEYRQISMELVGQILKNNRSGFGFPQ